MDGTDDRTARLAAALRENLKRRKRQLRGRDGAAGEAGVAEGGVDDVGGETHAPDGEPRTPAHGSHCGDPD